MPSEPDLTRERIERLLQTYRPKRCRLPGLQPAAVLAPLFRARQSGATHLWLLRRPDDGTPHGGQVALPGGKPSAEDANLQATALREAGEELGLAAARVHLLGQLDDYVTITRFRITPFVAWIDESFVPQPNAAEVARAFHAPLAIFLEPPTENVVSWGAYTRRVASFLVDGEIVWGATAAILRRFGDLLRT